MGIGLIVFVLFALSILFSAIRVIPEYERAIVFRFGRVLDGPKARYHLPNSRSRSYRSASLDPNCNHGYRSSRRHHPRQHLVESECCPVLQGYRYHESDYQRRELSLRDLPVGTNPSAIGIR